MSSLIKTLTSKPWETASDASGIPVDVRAFLLPRQKVGLRVFLFVSTSLFLLFIVSYRMRMYYEDWVPLKEPLMLWFNTGILVVASIFMQRAKFLAALGENAARGWFLAGGLAALLFVALQLVIWQQLASTGHFVSSNPASSFYYLVTAAHGLHILGGIAAWLLALMRQRGDFERFRMSVDLCTVYWHYLLIVWLALFWLLLTT
jgi:cytochrome c oxidase subunit 3